MAELAVPVLRTQRLLLRPWEDADLAQLSLLLGDAEALALWGEPLDVEGTREWIRRNRLRYGRHGFGRCAVVWADTGEVVGDCGLAPTEVEGTAEVELGWITRGSWWGRGIATEAGAAWRDYAFDVLRLDHIVSMISERNPASWRVAEKLGLAVERRAEWGGHSMLMYVLRAKT